MSLPYAEPLTARDPAADVVPEPPRRGEPGGEPCAICSGSTTSQLWGDEHFTLHAPVGCSLPGSLWLASRVHADSFADLPPAVAAAFGPLVARWGDGGAHFHVWMLPRPLGMLDAMGHFLPLWEDVLPNVSDDEARAAVEMVVATL